MEAQAMLAIWHDVESEFVEEYLKWHSFEHLPERLALPGFLAAHRLEHVEGPGQRFLCLIDVREAADLESPAYLARLNAPSDWTRRLMPRYANVQRALFRLMFRVGHGIGSETVCLRFSLRPGVAAEDFGVNLRRVLASQVGKHEVASARLAVVDELLNVHETEERRLRRQESTGDFDFLLTLDGVDPCRLRAAAAAVGGGLDADADRVAASIYRFSYLTAGSFRSFDDGQ